MQFIKFLTCIKRAIYIPMKMRLMYGKQVEKEILEYRSANKTKFRMFILCFRLYVTSLYYGVKIGTRKRRR